ncbi:hypothetical protein ACVWW4_006270 [Bradyrhizobium sp. LB7.1]
MRPEQMVARPARPDPARAGQASRDHATNGAERGRAEQRRRVHRLEGELLVLGIDQRQHVGQRRPGLERDNEFVGLVGGDGIQRGDVEHGVGRHRMTDAALAAMTDDLERLLIGNRRAHHLFDVFGVSNPERIHD